MVAERGKKCVCSFLSLEGVLESSLSGGSLVFQGDFIAHVGSDLEGCDWDEWPS